MNAIIRIFLSFLIPGLLFFPSWQGISETQKSAAIESKPGLPEKAGKDQDQNIRSGLYRIEGIQEMKGQKNALSFYRIVFHKEDDGRPAKEGVGKQVTVEPVWLNTYHVHAGLVKGSVYEIRAYGNAEKGHFEAMQVLVYLERTHGKSPVWMISRDKKGIDLRGSSFLKMHSPASDFAIF